MKVKKIQVMTAAGLVTFHVNDEGERKCLWESFEGKMIFQKLSGNDISFVQSNVIYVNEVTVTDNSGGDSVE